MRSRIYSLPLALCVTTCLVTVSALPQTSSSKGAPPRLAAANKELVSGQVDTTISRVYVYVGKEGLGHEHAVEGHLKSGTIKLGSGYEAGKLVFDMTSFNADTEEARRYIGLSGQTAESTRQKVNTNMLGPDVLHVKRFPTATFEVNSALPAKGEQSNSPTTYVLDGTFSLHTGRHPLKLQVQAEGLNGQVHLHTSFAIRQSMFGIKPYKAALGAIGVADELKIHGDLWIAK